MPFEVIDPEQFLGGKSFAEQAFLDQIERYDWSKCLGKKVLVRGCHSTIIPPWAYMCITGKLATVAHSVRFGNEHDNVVVFRSSK
ncbi:MAG TPA: DUF2480 family protein [Candidatus Deferrimicrobium sp.]|nr:DUF2480 family protein [Candidatus Deferrimicrobium sp.]